MACNWLQNSMQESYLILLSANLFPWLVHWWSRSGPIFVSCFVTGSVVNSIVWCDVSSVLGRFNENTTPLLPPLYLIAGNTDRGRCYALTIQSKTLPSCQIEQCPLFLNPGNVFTGCTICNPRFVWPLDSMLFITWHSYIIFRGEIELQPPKKIVSGHSIYFYMPKYGWCFKNTLHISGGGLSTQKMHLSEGTDSLGKIVLK